MRDANTVTPKAARGWSFTPLQLFGLGPKFTITCGRCDATFQKRLPTPMVGCPGITCPRCGTVNELPLVHGEGN